MTPDPQPPPQLLSGRTMLVAGVGPGLGSQVGIAAAEAGASVLLAARSDRVGPALAERLTAAGHRAAFQACDVTSDASCEAAVEAAVAAFGKLDTVVLNAMAGGPANAPLEAVGVDEWRDVFEVNLFGSLRLARAAIPALKQGTNPSLVFVGSQVVRRVLAGRGPYASSKAALQTAAQVLATELGPAGIRVNTVVPGRMWGPPLQSALPRLAAGRGRSEADELARWVEATALKRLASDEECARVVLFLASDQASAVTGQSVDVNAGETMPW